MDYLGDKLSVAHSQMSGWMGNVRRSLHSTFGLLSSSAERTGRAEDAAFKRTSSLRSLASRSRESIRRFSMRSQQRLSLRRRTAPNTPTAVQQKQSESGDAGEALGHDTDSQYGTWETGLRTDDSLSPLTPSSDSHQSPSPRKTTPPHTPGDSAHRWENDTVDAVLPSNNQLPAFPDAPPTLLDTSALRSRAQLAKKRAPRTRPSRGARKDTTLVVEDAAEDWLYRDSTETKVGLKDSALDSEALTRGPDSSAAVSSQPPRVALFPGVDASALKVQLRKRGDSDNHHDGPVVPQSQPSRSPKSPFLPRAARVLPPAGGKENGEEDSPQWLKELKSKKRLSQYDGES
eukprot:XP_011613764.1 PREDICTED: uncharacterized protein KIAA1671 homolog isoform X1 [Takifugu rubripes]